ncbi:D(1B) dopamine receptor-like [Ruditapes philippinarum]|uniref:D(1B) dopamine receptor-like n=1 Tax=Ruditapes philippinarum TaxID=129788 RepID=UPI00295B6AE1|nr:D(1B) dopamine receptor-like [Ruditapes philippinarum]
MNASEIENETINLLETSEHLNARYAWELLPLSILLGLIAVFGVMGNILTLVVFLLSKDYRGNTFRVFVIALAVIDLITCLTLFPIEILTHRFFFAFTDVILCKAKCFIAVFSASASSFILLLISADRFRKAMFPLKKQLTPSKSIKLSLLAAIIGPVILSFPTIVICGVYSTRKRNSFGQEIEVNVCETEEKYKTSTLRTIYKLVLLILQIGISIIYIILYPFVMREALRHKQLDRSIKHLKSSHTESDKSRSIEIKRIAELKADSCVSSRDVSVITLANREQKEDYIEPAETNNVIDKNGSKTGSQFFILSQKAKIPAKTLVWFLLTVVFIATFMAHLLLTLNISDTVDMSSKELFWFLFSYRLYFLNHVINPLVYAVFLKSFRASCRHVFSRKK